MMLDNDYDAITVSARDVRGAGLALWSRDSPVRIHNKRCTGCKYFNELKRYTSISKLKLS